MIHESPHPPVEIPDVSLAEFVLADAAARGERPALVDAASGRTLTYAGLDALARGVASGLQRRGLEPGQVVGILAPNLPEYAAAFLGVALAGGTNTTINGLYTEDEIAHQLRELAGAVPVHRLGAARPRAAGRRRRGRRDACSRSTAARARSRFADMLGPRRASCACRRSTRRRRSSRCPTRAARPACRRGSCSPTATWSRTSCRRSRWCPGGDEVVAGVLPFFHIYGQTAVMNCALRAGDTVVTLPRFDFEAVPADDRRAPGDPRLRRAADRRRALEAPGGRAVRPLQPAHDQLRGGAARRRPGGGLPGARAPRGCSRATGSPRPAR